MNHLSKAGYVLIGSLLGLIGSRTETSQTVMASYFGEPITASSQTFAKASEVAVANPPRPVMQIGFPGGFKIYPLDAAHENISSARVQVKQIAGAQKLKTPIRTDFETVTTTTVVDVFSADGITWDDKSVYEVTVTYSHTNGTTSVATLVAKDGDVVWWDVEGKPATETNPCAIVSTCNGQPFYTDTLSNHEIQWPATGSGKLIITIGSEILVISYTGCTINGIASCGTPGVTSNFVPDANDGFINFIQAGSTNGTALFRLKTQCMGQKLRVLIQCNNCTVTAKSC